MKLKVVLFLALAFMILSSGLARGEELQESISGEPVERGAESAEYTVGADDVVDIRVIKPEKIEITVAVTPDGTITFPYIGNIDVKGLTLMEMQDEIEKRLADGYMKYPVVSVSLRESRSKKFTVYGQVLRPGSYPLEENMTLLRAITMAGGFIQPGSTGKVELLRPKGKTEEFEIIESDITALLSGAKQDVIIEPGDTITVAVDKFFVYGQVLKPGVYPVEENMTILRAITVAGGFNQPGSTGKVKLLRPKTGKEDFEAIDAGITELLSGKYQNITVQPNDTIVVAVDKFFVYGQVLKPGAYVVEDKMTILGAITAAGGFIESGSTGKVKLLRSKAGSEDFETTETDISALLSGACRNIYIQPNDTIVVAIDKYFVYGEVARPGMYPLEANTTALTAISIAGGFTKFGSSSRVKILRMNEKTGAYDTVPVNMNDIMSGSAKANVRLKPGDVVVASEGVF